MSQFVWPWVQNADDTLFRIIFNRPRQQIVTFAKPKLFRTWFHQVFFPFSALQWPLPPLKHRHRSYLTLLLFVSTCVSSFIKQRCTKKQWNVYYVTFCDYTISTDWREKVTWGARKTNHSWRFTENWLTLPSILFCLSNSWGEMDPAGWEGGWSLSKLP